MIPHFSNTLFPQRWTKREDSSAWAKSCAKIRLLLRINSRPLMFLIINPQIIKRSKHREKEKKWMKLKDRKEIKKYCCGSAKFHQRDCSWSAATKGTFWRPLRPLSARPTAHRTSVCLEHKPWQHRTSHAPSRLSSAIKQPACTHSWGYLLLTEGKDDSRAWKNNVEARQTTSTSCLPRLFVNINTIATLNEWGRLFPMNPN